MKIKNLFRRRQKHDTQQQRYFTQFYEDEEETRSAKILRSLPKDQYIAEYPDFDVAYINSQYTESTFSAHFKADVSVLLDGLPRSRRKSLLLGRIAQVYAVQKEDPIETLKFAVLSLIAAKRPPDTPGDLVGAINILKFYMDGFGKYRALEKLNELQSQYLESKQMENHIKKLIANASKDPILKELVDEAERLILDKRFDYK